NGGLPPELSNLFTSGLADQVEQIKICPLSLTTEEISRLWTAFQARYRPTAAYQMSVVLIESDRSVRTPLPVRSRAIYVIPFQSPRTARPPPPPNAPPPPPADHPTLRGYFLVIEAPGLRSDNPIEPTNGADPTRPNPANITDTRITLTIPAS